ncbi:MAG: MarR family winged helix-turn-helix transcriptional regulator [Paracoccus sp. (in: a-proteobacteria)]
MTFDLDGFLPYQLNVAATQISRRFAALYEAEVGLSIPEWRVLAHLSRSGAVSVRDIHIQVNLDKSVVSRAASKLEQAGLVKKSGHEGDRRLIALELTDQGHALMQRLGRIAEAFQAKLMGELGPLADGLSEALTRLGAPQTTAA